MLDKIEKEVDVNKSKVLSIENDLRDFKESLNFQETTIMEKINKITKRYEKEINNLNKKTLDLENRSRRNNLRLDGIFEKPNENWNECENAVKEMFKKQLKISNEIIIERAHRIGQPKEDKKPRTIVLKLLNFQDKTKILNATKNLRGTGIYVNEDFAKETMESRRMLWEEVKKLRLEGKYAVIKYDKIVSREFRKNDLSVSDGDGEILTIEIINERTKNILVSCCYRPPDGVSENLSMFLQQNVIAKELSAELSFDEFEKAFKSFKKNKAPGADEINGNIVIDCYEQLKNILFKIFRASIHQAETGSIS
nr:uncharacterized protein LOC124814805 [Hydra vulgaris]